MALLAHQLLVFSSCLFAATAAFISTPSSVNVTLGSTATFNCSATTGVIVWIVNGSLLTELLAPDITSSNVGHVLFLHIPATEQYSNTNVTCAVAVLGGDVLYSDPAVLRVQGLLSSVSDLVALPQRGVISLTWTPPFSLDITGVDPDLWYRVDVYNITSGRAPLTNLTVYEPEFNFTVPNSSLCDQFEFRVTPVNGAGNGIASEPVRGCFLRRSLSVEAAGVEVTFGVVSRVEKSITLTFPTILRVCEIPDTFRVYVEAVDDDTPLPPHSFTATSIYANRSITLTFHALNNDLPSNRLYTLVIESGNRAEKINSTGVIQLSTHDVQRATASSSADMPGTVTVQATFAVNSPALGFLVILVDSRGTAVSFTSTLRPNHTVVISELATADSYTVVSYTVVVFDVENTGLPSTRAAAMDVVIVTNTEPIAAPPNSTTDSVHIELLTDGTVCVTCFFTAGSGSQGCVTLIFSARDPTRLEVLPLPKLGSLLRTEVCLNVTKEIHHTIAVFDWEKGRALGAHPVKIQHFFISLPSTPTVPTLHNDTEHLSACGVPCIIGIASGGLLLSVVVSTICVIMVAGMKKCRGKQTVSEAGAVVKIPMQTNTAYESHQISNRHQPPQMKPCTAYGVVGTDSRPAVLSSHV